jgi:hypothetical protein
MNFHRVTVLTVACLALGLAAVTVVFFHPVVNVRTAVAVNEASSGNALLITGKTETVGGPMAPGDKSPKRHAFSGIIAVYTDAAATGTPIQTTPVSATHESYRFTLHKSGTYYLVPETNHGFQQGSPQPVRAQLGQHEIANVSVYVP